MFFKGESLTLITNNIFIDILSYIIAIANREQKMQHCSQIELVLWHNVGDVGSGRLKFHTDKI